ncbi:MAG TPA: hypothetical protein V6C65_13795 [Allocoleopsis sp.]
MNSYLSANVFMGFSIGWLVVLFLIFGLLRLLQVPTGHFQDWVIGGMSFWWLLVIVTVPWNIHFQAKSVVAEAHQSIDRQIEVDEQQVAYARVIARRALWVAIGLHLVSSLGLYGLAVAGISSVGYLGSGAALLLTLLRPAIRAYEYVAERLNTIHQQITYPREDVVTLRDRVQHQEEAIQRLEDQLNPENPLSWLATQKRDQEALQRDLTHLAASLEQLRATNQAEHTRLAREAQNAVAQLAEDSVVLSQVREIIRFFKQA